MAGICAWGSYLPIHRLPREVVDGQGFGAKCDQVPIANYDEDIVTMAFEAGLNCMEEYGGKVGHLFLASMLPAVQEKQNAVTIGSALGISRESRTVDFFGSARSGVKAVLTACDVADAGKGPVLVSAANDGNSGTDEEGVSIAGSGGAALVVGDENVIAEIEYVVSIEEDFPERWRMSGDAMVQVGDKHFTRIEGFPRVMEELITSVLDRSALNPSDVEYVLLCSGDRKQRARVAERVGFKDEQLVPSSLSKVGDLGAISPMVELIDVLGRAQPGERILFTSYAEGGDAVVLKMTGQRKSRGKPNRGWQWQLDNYLPIESYGQYARMTGKIGGKTYKPYSSLAMLQREHTRDLQFVGTKCEHCGKISFPGKKVCDRCKHVDRLSDFPLAREGTVYTYTHDYVYSTPTPPLTMAAVDLDGGGRFFGQVTDCNHEEFGIGMDVELCLRRIHDALRLPHYFWKARPNRA